MYSFSQPQPTIPNLDAFIREEERKHKHSYNGLELTTVFYDEDRTIIFEKKLIGDGKTIVTFLPTKFTAENGYRQVSAKYLADENTCRQEHPEAF